MRAAKRPNIYTLEIYDVLFDTSIYIHPQVFKCKIKQS